MLVLGNGIFFVFPLWVWPCYQRCDDPLRISFASRRPERANKTPKVLRYGLRDRDARNSPSLPGLTEKNLPEA